MSRLRGALAALLVAGSPMTITACGWNTSPCAGLHASAQDKQAAKKGYEVERQVGSVECELTRSGTWVVDD